MGRSEPQLGSARRVSRAWGKDANVSPQWHQNVNYELTMNTRLLHECHIKRRYVGHMADGLRIMIEKVIELIIIQVGMCFLRLKRSKF